MSYDSIVVKCAHGATGVSQRTDDANPLELLLKRVLVGTTQKEN